MTAVPSDSHILITPENPGGIIIPGRFSRRILEISETILHEIPTVLSRRI